MSVYQPAYRFEVRAPRSTDVTEATVLTPVAGAPHSDLFRVSTLPNDTGWQPYLEIPRGRRGRIDTLSKRTDTGQLVFRLLDKRLTSSSNLSRWVSAFFGDINGEIRVGYLLVLAWESLNGGGTWTAFWTGRLTRIQNVGRLQFDFYTRDTSDELQALAWVGRPHSSITYTGLPMLLPVGLATDYGTIKKSTPLIGSAGTYRIGPYPVPDVKAVTFDQASLSRSDNIVTQNLVSVISPDQRIIVGGGLSGVQWANMATFFGTGRAIVKHTSGANNGSTGTYLVGGLALRRDVKGHYQLTGCAIKALQSGDVGFLALPADAVTLEVHLISDSRATEETPLFVNDVHPVQLWKDLLDGKFGFLWTNPEVKPAGVNYGDVKRAFSYDSAAFTTLIADTRFPKARFIITKRQPMHKWIEDSILKPYHLGYYISSENKIVPVDLRFPVSIAGLQTITDSHLIEGETSDWEYNREAAITRVDAKYYEDLIIAPTVLANAPPGYPSLPKGMVQTIEHTLIVYDIGRSDLGDRPFDLDLPGYRTMPEEPFDDTQSRAKWLVGRIEETIYQFRRPHGVGPTTMRLRGLRNTPVKSNPGELRLLAVTTIPDPATNKRGGTRLIRVTEQSEEGIAISVNILDLAIAVISTVPTVGAPAQEAGAEAFGITSLVTVNALAQPVELQYAVTTTSVGAAPAETSPLWTSAGNLVRATGTIVIKHNSPGRRLWVRGRTVPDPLNEPQLPSAWVVTASVDAATLAAPTNVAVPAGTLKGKSARVTWTVAHADLRHEVRLITPTTDPLVHIDYVIPGGNLYDLFGLTPSTTYRVGIRSVADSGVVSSEVTVDFTTGATSNVCPATGSINVAMREQFI